MASFIIASISFSDFSAFSLQITAHNGTPHTLGTQVQAWTVLVCRRAQYMVPSFFGNPSIRARSPSSVSCSAVWVVAASVVEEGRWGAPGAAAATAVGAEARGKRVTTRATVGAKWERLLLRRDLLGQLRVVSGLLSAQAWRDMEDRWRDAWLGGRPR